MSVLKNKRGLSKLEFYHNARRMRKEITNKKIEDLLDERKAKKEGREHESE